MDHVSWPRPFQGRFLIYSWDLLCLTHIPNLKCLRLPAAMMWKATRNVKILRFEPPSGGLRGNVHGSSMAHWKARDGLPISANWTFVASYHCSGTMSGYWSSTNFRRTGVHVADLSHEKKSSRVMRWWLSRLSSRFGAKSSHERKPKWLPGLYNNKARSGRRVWHLVWKWMGSILTACGLHVAIIRWKFGPNNTDTSLSMFSTSF